jgi:hypothetical protein
MNKRWVCNCPDFSRKQPATGRYISEQSSRDWSQSNAGSGNVLGRQLDCKHIKAVKVLLGEPITDDPNDVKDMADWKEYIRQQAVRQRSDRWNRRARRLARRKRNGGRSAAFERYQRWLKRIENSGLSKARKEMGKANSQYRKAKRRAVKSYMDGLYSGFKTRKGRARRNYVEDLRDRYALGGLQPYQKEATKKFLDGYDRRRQKRSATKGVNQGNNAQVNRDIQDAGG